jgi:WD40 repeat protein
VNFEEALEVADEAYSAKIGRRLNDVETFILHGSWQGRIYEEMATDKYKVSYLKCDVGPKFWKQLTEALGEKVSKRNFRAALERRLHPKAIVPKQKRDATSPHSTPELIKLNQLDAASKTRMGEEQPHELSASRHIHVDRGEAPDVSVFFGRSEELNRLEHWISHDQCRLIAILGMRGIGKTRLSVKLGLGQGGIGKTHLSLKLAESIQERFDYVIWRSLLSVPPVMEILADWINVLSNHQATNLPDTEDARIALLLSYLRDQRCLLILDNAESILQAGEQSGRYREGCEGYGSLLRKIGELPHRSCLLLTSREKPQEIALLEGKTLPVRSLELSGLDRTAGRQIFETVGTFSGSKAEWQRLIELYNGNPLALELAAKHIDQVFSGSISEFLQLGKPIFSNLRDLLNWHFDRLANDEKEILYWLAINGDPVSLAELKQDLVSPIAKEKIVDTLQSLQMRLPIETRAVAAFTLQPVLIEYVTERLIREVLDEIQTGNIDRLNQYALLKATAKDYVRESQSRRILAPLQDLLIGILGGPDQVKVQLVQLLTQHRQTSPRKPGYLGGNILNLLCKLHDKTLKGYDFSDLAVWQAYIQGAKLQDVDFSRADLDRSVFTNALSIVLTVAISPDGCTVATGDSNHNIRLWNIADGRQLLSFPGHSDWVWSVRFSPDGRYLASGSDDRTVRLWDICTGECQMVLEHDNWVRAVAYSPDGKKLASGSDGGIVRIWDLQSYQCLHRLAAHKSRVWSVAFSPTSEQLVSGSDDNTLRIWHVQTGECQAELSHSDRVQCVTFSPDGQTLASGGADASVKIWDLDSGRCRWQLDLNGYCVWSVAYSPSGQQLAVGSDSTMVKVYDVATGDTVGTFYGHSDRVWSVAFSADGNKLASGSHDKTLKIWDVFSGKCLQTLQGQINRVWSIAFSADGQTLASGSEDRHVRIWSLNSYECIHSFQEQGSWIWSVAFSPDSKTLATGSDDKLVKLWDVNQGKLVKVCPDTPAFKQIPGHSNLRHTNWVVSVAFSAKGDLLASGSEDTTVKIWDVNTGNCLKTLLGHKDRVRSVAFSPDGRELASSGDDGTVRIWNLATGNCLAVLNGHGDRVRAVAFSPDHLYFASGGDDKTVQLWDRKKRVHRHTFSGHEDSVVSIAFSPDSQTIVSSSDDRTLKVWDIQSGHCLYTLAGHTAWVRSVAFSSDNQTIASGSRDGTIKLWDARIGQCRRTLEAPGPYAGMRITGATGLNAAQKSALKILGAIE